jgi:hypothetical protein
MASPATGLRRLTPTPVGVSKLWTDNSEPKLGEMLDDSVIRAVMACDGVTQGDVLKLLVRFHSTASDRPVEDGIRPFFDPPQAIFCEPTITAKACPSRAMNVQDGASYERTKGQAA